MANVLKAHGVAKGDRVTIYLPMIPEAAYAMLACARIGAVHSVIFGGFSPDSIAGRIQDCDSRIVITADEGLRGGQDRALEAERGSGPHPMPGRRHRAGGPPHRRQGVHAPGPRPRLRGRGGQGLRRLPGRAHGRGGPAVHPLHLRLDGKAQGRAAHHRRLPRLGRLHPRTDLRLSAGRGLLVHRRRRLGDRPQLHRLWAPGQRRDHPDLRGRAQPSHRQPVLGGDRQAQGGDLLHRPHRPSRPDARGRRAGEAHLARVAAPAGHGGRADQSGGLAMVPPRGGRRALPDRRHLVADRDRRRPDLAPARRHAAQAGLGDQAPAGGQAAARRCRRRGAGGGGQRQSLPHRQLAGPDAHRSRATTSASSPPISPPIRASISPATAAAATPTATTGSPGGWTT